MTRRAYVQVRCAVVALWSERHQRYATKTGPDTSNLTQNYGFAGSSFLERLVLLSAAAGIQGVDAVVKAAEIHRVADEDR